MQHQGPTFDQPWYKCTLVHCDWIHEHWPCSPPFFPNHLWSVCTAVRQLTNPSIHQFVGLMIRLCTNVFFEVFLNIFLDAKTPEESIYFTTLLNMLCSWKWNVLWHESTAVQLYVDMKWTHVGVQQFCSPRLSSSFSEELKVNWIEMNQWLSTKPYCNGLVHPNFLNCTLQNSKRSNSVIQGRLTSSEGLSRHFARLMLWLHRH